MSGLVRGNSWYRGSDVEKSMTHSRDWKKATQQGERGSR